MRRSATGYLLLITVFFSGGCASMRQPASYLSNLGLNSRPLPGDFDVCDSAGCRSITGLGYSEEEWQSIAGIFEPPPGTAAAERERINVAVGAMETIIGKKN
ncbi:MAG TPA: hypothetical protein VJ952_08565, partial [Opitutales bacterium]|nr:hypothetical protein [Opitutales bacterium]